MTSLPTTIVPVTKVDTVLRATIGRAHNGPPDAAHGGYACATLVRVAQPRRPVAVTLLAPVPLDTPLMIGARRPRRPVHSSDALVATLAEVAREPGATAPVGAAVAEAASRGFHGWTEHPFPTCFACGHDRVGGDGLRLAPGPVAGRPGTVACCWTPAPEAGDPVPEELVWSVLDCPGGWIDEPGPRPRVLSRMSVTLCEPVTAGRRHVVTGTVLRRQGPTMSVGTALWTETGRLVAKASAVWADLPADTHPH